jgi:hypothetical protein
VEGETNADGVTVSHAQHDKASDEGNMEYYNSDNLDKRERLRFDPTICHELSRWWEATRVTGATAQARQAFFAAY